MERSRLTYPSAVCLPRRPQTIRARNFPAPAANDLGFAARMRFRLYACLTFYTMEWKGDDPFNIAQPVEMILQDSTEIGRSSGRRCETWSSHQPARRREGLVSLRWRRFSCGMGGPHHRCISRFSAAATWKTSMRRKTMANSSALPWVSALSPLHMRNHSPATVTKPPNQSVTERP